MLKLLLEAPRADAATADATAGATLAAEAGSARNHRGRAARGPSSGAAEEEYFQKEVRWMVVEPLEMRCYAAAAPLGTPVTGVVPIGKDPLPPEIIDGIPNVPARLFADEFGVCRDRAGEWAGCCTAIFVVEGGETCIARACAETVVTCRLLTRQGLQGTAL